MHERAVFTAVGATESPRGCRVDRRDIMMILRSTAVVLLIPAAKYYGVLTSMYVEWEYDTTESNKRAGAYTRYCLHRGKISIYI